MPIEREPFGVEFGVAGRTIHLGLSCRERHGNEEPDGRGYGPEPPGEPVLLPEIAARLGPLFGVIALVLLLGGEVTTAHLSQLALAGLLPTAALCVIHFWSISRRNALSIPTILRIQRVLNWVTYPLALGAAAGWGATLRVVLPRYDIALLAATWLAIGTSLLWCVRFRGGIWASLAHRPGLRLVVIVALSFAASRYMHTDLLGTAIAAVFVVVVLIAIHLRTCALDRTTLESRGYRAGVVLIGSMLSPDAVLALIGALVAPFRRRRYAMAAILGLVSVPASAGSASAQAVASSAWLTLAIASSMRLARHQEGDSRPYGVVSNQSDPTSEKYRGPLWLSHRNAMVPCTAVSSLDRRCYWDESRGVLIIASAAQSWIIPVKRCNYPATGYEMLTTWDRNFIDQVRDPSRRPGALKLEQFKRIPFPADHPQPLVTPGGTPLLPLRLVLDLRTNGAKTEAGGKWERGEGAPSGHFNVIMKLRKNDDLIEILNRRLTTELDPAIEPLQPWEALNQLVYRNTPGMR